MRETFAASLRRQRMQAISQAEALAAGGNSSSSGSIQSSSPEKSFLPCSQIPPLDDMLDPQRLHARDDCTESLQLLEFEPRPPPGAHHNTPVHKHRASHRSLAPDRTGSTTEKAVRDTAHRGLADAGNRHGGEKETMRPALQDDTSEQTHFFLEEMRRRFSASAVEERARQSLNRQACGDDALLTFELIVDCPLKESDTEAAARTKGNCSKNMGSRLNHERDVHNMCDNMDSCGMSSSRNVREHDHAAVAACSRASARAGTDAKQLQTPLPSIIQIDKRDTKAFARVPR